MDEVPIVPRHPRHPGDEESSNLVTEVLEGLEDAEAGRLISTEQLLKKVDEWSG